jgi:8-oxo-dGTP pyrophosphatase MutT (NUDIX family)
MINETENPPSVHAKDMLLEDYRNLADCFWKNEESGETRVHLFVGLVTACLGGLVTLASSERHLPGEPLRLTILGSLFVLIVLGVVTLFRMLTRNESTDRYKHGCEVVRQMFKDYFDPAQILPQYYPFSHPGDETKKKKKKGMSRRKIGGLTHSVAVVNGLLLAGFAAAVVYPGGIPITLVGDSLRRTYVSFAGSFCLAVIAQFFYVNWRENRAEGKLREAGPSHAGGIVYRVENHKVEYLLVGPKIDVPGEWLLPKGHLEPCEGHGECALREVREESGVVARIIGFVERVEFNARKKENVRGKEVTRTEKVRGKYYLMEFLYQTNERYRRPPEWHVFAEAQQMLTYAVDKYLLQAADRKRREMASSGASTSARGAEHDVER